MDSGFGKKKKKSALERNKDFQIPQHGDGKKTGHLKHASPGFAKPPAAGKHDADSEKQPWLSVWTTLKQADPFFRRASIGSFVERRTQDRRSRLDTWQERRENFILQS